MKGLKVCVTAGPTRETIDPVRFISNRSTGKMGFALAKNAMERGADVTLVSGPVELKDVPFVKMVHVESARQMFEAVTDRRLWQMKKSRKKTAICQLHLKERMT